MSDKSSSSIIFDPTNAALEKVGVTQADLLALQPGLALARAQLLDDLRLSNSGEPLPPERRPLDTGFIDFPERLLEEHRKNPETSQLTQIQKAAIEIAAFVDRVVVIGIGGSYMGARSLFEATCHPYHNQLNRTERKDRPRLYFAGYNVDNDSTQGLMDILGREVGPTAEARWGLMVVSKSGETIEPAIAFRQFFKLLENSSGGNDELSKKAIVVTSEGSRLHKIAAAAKLRHIFYIPENVGGRYSIFTACGLLPAAILGLDIVRLIEGVVEMNSSFRSAEGGSNPVLDYVGVCHLLESRGATIRVLSLWDQGLEAFGFWYDQLLAESLGKNEMGATPITNVNTRDLHSRGQQHQEGRRDKIITNVVLNQSRREPLPIGFFRNNEDGLDRLSDKSLVDVMNAAEKATNLAYNEVNRPTLDIRVPGVDEFSLGQLYQMFMLATSVEGYLLGINPFGQPGVEAYKRHLKSLLSSND
jgi:glucose-6-phosphate isomerase